MKRKAGLFLLAVMVAVSLGATIVASLAMYRLVSELQDDEIHKITWENACRFYGWDPCTPTTREQATVGALRQAAEGHDVSVHALSRHQTGERPTNALAEATKFNN